MDADSVAVPHTGAAANLVRYNLMGHRKKILQCCGVPRAETYLARARFEFGRGRWGEVRSAAEIPGGIVGNRGKFATFATGADILGVLCTGALESPGGQSDAPRNMSTSHCVLRVAPLWDEVQLSRPPISSRPFRRNVLI